MPNCAAEDAARTAAPPPALSHAHPCAPHRFTTPPFSVAALVFFTIDGMTAFVMAGFSTQVHSGARPTAWGIGSLPGAHRRGAKAVARCPEPGWTGATAVGEQHGGPA